MIDICFFTEKFKVSKTVKNVHLRCKFTIRMCNSCIYVSHYKFIGIVNSQSKCNSSKEAALSAKNSSINFKKKAKNNKKGG